MPLPSDIMLSLVALADAAGAEIMRVRAGGVEVSAKSDGSPVTLADQAAEAVILAGLPALAPGIPVVAEEQAAAGNIPTPAPVFFLIDPLDGTKEFVRGSEEFTVNIGLVENGVPTAGVVVLPASGIAYWTGGDGVAWRRLAPGADAQRICCRPAPAAGATVVASKSHRTPETDAFIATLANARVISAGSSAKFCRVAEGVADVYPRFGPTMEWDTAAGDAVVRAAGGLVTTVDGAALTYGKAGYRNPDFICRGPGRGAG
ncbi:MAG: 3'(2'),5'-bisphosphate nucleotidase CysQ [Actinomycetota bacterium]